MSDEKLQTRETMLFEQAREQAIAAERQRIAEMARQEADLEQMTAEGEDEIGKPVYALASRAAASALRAFAERIEKGEVGFGKSRARGESQGSG